MKADAKDKNSSILPPLDDRVIRAVRRELLVWYRQNRRVLPWRSTASQHPDPYHVFISEAMLQQTQVVTVIPYFERFLKAFPTIHALAAASEQDVLREWQGLGYYRRARNLHAAAQKIVADHDGKIPSTVDVLLKLPGIGRYTAGAIASIAYGVAAPILDGNVARVLARLLAIRQSIDERDVVAALWIASQKMVQFDAESGESGDFNQSLMELGATVCVPANPRCDACPVANWCEAKMQKLVADIPARTARAKPVDVSHHIVALEQVAPTDGSPTKLIFEQRPNVGLWSNMWQMPTLELTDDDKIHREADVRKWLIGMLGVRVGRLKKVGQFKHQTTHRTIAFTLWHGCVEGTGAGVGTATLGLQRTTRIPVKTSRVWRVLSDIADLPLANPQKAAIKLLLAKEDADAN